MECEEIDSRGSCIAYGVGLSYEYSLENQTINIKNIKGDRPLLALGFKSEQQACLQSFVQNIEKATQIHALMFSNNDTCDITETLDEERLTPILESSIKLAKYSLDLQQAKLKRFSQAFCDDFALKRLQLKILKGSAPDQNLYVAKLKTKRNSTTSARSETLHGILRDLSDKTVRDLMTSEYITHHARSAHNLLTVSSKLSTISRILDKEFSPHKIIARRNNENMKDKSTKSKKTV